MRRSSPFHPARHSRKSHAPTRLFGGERLEDRSLLALTVSLVADVRPGATDGLLAGLPIVEAGGQAYFGANNGATGTELWKTNGTTAGTVLVKDIFAGSGSSTPGTLGA